MGIITKAVVQGTLLEDNKGVLKLVGEDLKRHAVTATLSGISKDNFISSQAKLIEKSHEATVEKLRNNSKITNLPDRLKQLEDDKKNRLEQLKEGKVSVLIEEGTAVYVPDVKRWLMTANAKPTETSNGRTYYPVKLVESNKNGKENLSVEIKVSGMVAKEEWFNSLSDKEKQNIKYSKDSENAENMRYKNNLSVHDVTTGRIDYSTVSIKATLNDLRKDLLPALEIEKNYLNYMVNEQDRVFQGEKNRYTNDKNVQPKTFITVPQARLLNIVGVEDTKTLVKKIFEKANARLNLQKDENNNSKHFYIPFANGENTIKIDHTNIERIADKNPVALQKVYRGLLTQFGNREANMLKFFDSKIDDDVARFTKAKNDLRKQAKEMGQGITPRQLNEKAALILKMQDGDKAKEVSFYNERVGHLQDYMFIQKVDELKNAKDLSEYGVAVDNLTKLVNDRTMQDIPLKVTLPLKTLDFAKKNDIEYQKKYVKEMKGMVEKIAKDIRLPVEKTILSFALSKSDNPYIAEKREKLKDLVELDIKNSKIIYKQDKNGFLPFQRASLSVGGQVELPHSFVNKDGKTINPTSVQAFHIADTFTRKHLSGVGGRDFVSNSRPLLKELLGESYTATASLNNGEVDYEAMKNLSYNPLTGDIGKVKVSKPRKPKKQGDEPTKAEPAKDEPIKTEVQKISETINIDEVSASEVLDDIPEAVAVEDVPVSVEATSNEVQVESLEEIANKDAEVMSIFSDEGIDPNDLAAFLGSDFTFDDEPLDTKKLNDATQKLSIDDADVQTAFAPN